MKEFLKALLTVSLIVVIVFGVRELIFAQEESLLVSGFPDDNKVTSSVEREILSLILELRNINLNTELFQSNVFQSLVDFGVELDPQPVGRPNPFAPIGQDEVASSDDLDLDLGNFEEVAF